MGAAATQFLNKRLSWTGLTKQLHPELRLETARFLVIGQLLTARSW